MHPRWAKGAVSSGWMKVQVESRAVAQTSRNNRINMHVPHTQSLGVCDPGLYKPSADINYRLSLFNMCAVKRDRGECLQNTAAVCVCVSHVLVSCN